MNFLPKRLLAVGKEAAVVLMFVGKEGVHYLNVMGGAVLGQGQLGRYRGSSAATELVHDARF
jgi:hypothetical protein